jgi:glutamate-ammonia-ligase adenylyltransferase
VRAVAELEQLHGPLDVRQPPAAELEVGRRIGPAGQPLVVDPGFDPAYLPDADGLGADAVVGDESLRKRFTDLIDPLRYPEGGLSDDDIVEVRRIKARVDTERLPRRADASRNAKLGPGGLADIEWTVQLLQLRHAGAIAGLRTTSTLVALCAAQDAGLMVAQDAADLEAAWLFASRVRNAIVLAANKPDDQLPGGGRPLAAVGRALGYPTGFDPGQLEDDFRRAARRARRVVERLFYD